MKSKLEIINASISEIEIANKNKFSSADFKNLNENFEIALMEFIGIIKSRLEKRRFRKFSTIMPRIIH